MIGTQINLKQTSICHLFWRKKIFFFENLFWIWKSFSPICCVFIVVWRSFRLIFIKYTCCVFIKITKIFKTSLVHLSFLNKMWLYLPNLCVDYIFFFCTSFFIPLASFFKNWFVVNYKNWWNNLERKQFSFVKKFSKRVFSFFPHCCPKKIFFPRAQI